MTIWLINPYGTLPNEAWRDYRFTVIGRELAKQGNTVVWWTGAFSHHFKKHRSKVWQDIKVEERFVIRLVPTFGYRSNIGLGRVVRDYMFALKTYNRGKHIQPPNYIITAESPLTLGLAGIRLASFHKIRVIYDQMDLWPELFERVMPKYALPLIRTLNQPIVWARKYNYGKLNAVMALSSTYLKAAIAVNPKLEKVPQAVVYNGIDVRCFREKMALNSQKVKLIKTKGETWAIFAGSLGPSYDILTLIECAKILASQQSSVKILIAGDGPLKDVIKSAASGLGKTLTFLGQLSAEELCGVYGQCDIGLAAYGKASNVEMPDKFF